MGRAWNQTKIWNSVKHKRDCCGASAYPVHLTLQKKKKKRRNVFDVVIGFSALGKCQLLIFLGQGLSVFSTCTEFSFILL